MSITLPLDLLKKYKCNYFVETGTFRGDGVQKAIEAGFPNIYSIEENMFLFNSCRQRFAHNNTVHITFGSSSLYLYKMIWNIPDKITFWLDAHTETSTPILDELQQIGKHDLKEHTILIDDVRLFGDDRYFKYVNINTVIDSVLRINKKYKVEFEDSLYAPRDILVAYI